MHTPGERLDANRLRVGMLRGVLFFTEDVDADAEHFRASDAAEVLQEPMDEPHGVRDCPSRGPARSLVRMSQRKG